MQVMGVGRQESLPRIVELIEQEYSQRRAAPSQLNLKAADVDVLCERAQADAPFQTWTLRFESPGSLRDTLQEIQSEFPDDCECSEGETELVFRVRRRADDETAPLAPLDKLSEVYAWPEVWRVEGEDPPRERLSAGNLFAAMRDRNASDVHLYPGAAPVFRVNNKTVHTDDFAPVSQWQIEELIREIAPESAWNEFQTDKQCSFNYRHVGLAYSRVSAFVKAGVPHCTIRYLPEVVPSFEDLHVPRPIMERLAALHEGLVVVSGMTGSGKSTTVASLIDWINENKSLHILTIEAPVEYVHVNKKSIISQRDVGTDAPTAVKAVYAALRHDPDVIFIGEMREPDTIRAAIDAAGTGHLVITTFHANNAAEVPNRIVSFFDPVERDLVRLQLRDCLRCVMSQRLVPRKEEGRIPALEFLFNDTVQISDCILSGNTAALRVAMQQTATDSSIFETSLLKLMKEDLISDESAAAYASNAAILEQMRLGTYAVPSLDTMISRNR